MALLYHSGVPVEFWVDSFSTAVFLLNRLPSSALPHSASPFQMFHNNEPWYASFRVFGCRCFSYIKAYSSNKFD